MLALNDSELEIHLRNAIEREEANSVNLELPTLEAISYKLMPQKNISRRFRAGGIESISDEVWNILWKAAIKID